MEQGERDCMPHALSNPWLGDREETERKYRRKAVEALRREPVLRFLCSLLHQGETCRRAELAERMGKSHVQD